MTNLGFSINVRIGIWLDDLRLGIKQGLKTIAPLKLETIGLDAFGPEINPRHLGRSGRHDLAQFIRARGAALAALRADVGGRRLADPQTLDVNLSRLREAMLMAADLSVSHMIVAGGYIPPIDDRDNLSHRTALGEAVRVLAMASSSLGVRVCWLGGNEAPEVLKEFLDTHDPSGLVEADLNPGGYVMRGIDPLKAVNALSSRVSMATAVDHYQGGAEAPFGLGDVRWGNILVGLSTLQRNAPIDLLAACNLDGDRVQALSGAYKRLVAWRQHPLG